jgi:hypothetical protein
MSDDGEGLELVDYSEIDQIKRKRRRRKRSKRGDDPVVESIPSAGHVLSAAARQAMDFDVESSPASSFPDSPRDRKMSALTLDDISEEHIHTSSTWTPGSVDSSRSLWELGSIEADEDEILSLRDFSKSPVIPSLRMLQSASFEEDDEAPPQSLADLTARIESILGTIGHNGRTHLSRLCVPQSTTSAPPRLCIDPSFVSPSVRQWLGRVQTSLGAFSDTVGELIAAATQPDGLSAVMKNLGESQPTNVVCENRTPVINRRQRREFEKSRHFD